MHASSEAHQSGFGRLLPAIIVRPIVVKALLILLGVLPALALLACIRAFAVNIPFMDDWQFVPLLEKAKNGTLTLEELWAPHDEHRLLIPRIIIIASMFATGGDYRAQSYITFAVVAVVSVCLLWLMMRLNGNRDSVLWAWVLANIALFSPIQFHNWLWPMQFAYFLPYTFLALCFCTLYARIGAVPKFVVAAAFALAGNYSFVQGNLIWPAALPIILFAPDILSKGARRKFAMAWIALGALAVTLYFRGLEHNSAAPDYAYGHEGVPPMLSTLRLLQEQPFNTISRMGLFMLSMFGNSIARGFPVSSNLVFSQICGLIVLILAVIGLAVAWRRRLFFNHALPWTCLLLFTFLTAAFVCVGRVWRGDLQPLTPRYTTFGTLCIVSLIALLYSAFSRLAKELDQYSSASVDRRNVFFWSQGLLVGIFLCIQGVNWAYGYDLMEEWRLTRWHARARLHFLGKLPICAGPNLLGGKEELIEVMTQKLERLGMLKPPRADDLRISALGREVIPDGVKRGRFDGLTMCGTNGWRASGSALSSGGRSADAVILAVQNAAGEWIAIAAATPLSAPQYLHKSTRMDLEFLAVSAPQKRGEWNIDIPMNSFGEIRSGVLRAWAMDFPRRILYRLPGDQNFSVISERSEELIEQNTTPL
ncbi:MAG: hypothetical protein ABW214_05485 [Terrimicrobiaceae bacterium]